MFGRTPFLYTLREIILEVMDLLNFIICLSQWLLLQKRKPLDVIGYLEIHAEPWSAERSQSVPLVLLSSYHFTSEDLSCSLIFFAPDIYSFWSVIQLIQTMSIFRQREQLLILMVWGCCQARSVPGSCPLWEETHWPLKCVQSAWSLLGRLFRHRLS